MKTPLQQFSEKVLLVKQLEQSKEIIAYLGVVEEKNILQNELKTWSTENGDAEDSVVKVQKIEKWRKWFDVSVLKKNKKAYEALKDGGAIIVTEEVDKVVAETLAREEKVDRAVLAKAFKEEEMTPAIKITVK